MKGKGKVKRILTALLLCAVTVGSLGVSAFAEEVSLGAAEDYDVEVGIDDASASEIEATEENEGASGELDKPTDDVGSAVSEDNEAEASDETEKTENGESAEQKSFFEKLYDSVTDYLGEILCALAFGASCLIAVAYKKGLLPLLSGALGKLSGAVGSIKESTDGIKTVASGAIDKIGERLKSAEELIFKQSAYLEDIKARLDEEGRRSELDTIKTALEGELELLYDIFMSSSLPEYQKTNVARRLSEIRGEDFEKEA